MRFFRHIRFDLTSGLLGRKMCVCYLLWILFMMIACAEFSGQLLSFEITEATFGDYFLYIFGGMKEYIPTPGEPFKIPYLWLLVHLGILYFTLHYMYDDLHGFGQQLILRSKSRITWWVSKCIWNVVAVVVFYVLAWSTIALWAQLHHAAHNFQISSFLFEWMLPEMQEKNTSESLVWEITWMPLMVTIAASMFQMFLSFFLNPMLCYIISIVHFLAAAYYLSPFLLGNYAMALRSNKAIANGVDLCHGTEIAIAGILLSVFLGMLIFQRYNILSKEEA